MPKELTCWNLKNQPQGEVRIWQAPHEETVFLAVIGDDIGNVGVSSLTLLEPSHSLPFFHVEHEASSVERGNRPTGTTGSY